MPSWQNCFVLSIVFPPQSSILLRHRIESLVLGSALAKQASFEGSFTLLLQKYPELFVFLLDDGWGLSFRKSPVL
jgi:hypothetical protein